MTLKCGFLLSALVGATFASTQDFTPLPSVYEVDQRMEMMIANFNKYNANLDFSENGF